MKDLFDLLYLVYEGELVTQREFAESMHISLGKVNSLFKEALHEGYVNFDNEYTLSEKAISWLEQYKVDNAVIMAAGFGSRFVPMTYETPKGLLKVFNEVLIERQIKQLQSVGINDITIVVGYLKESFEYLSDKYNVKLIYNKDYSVKNNISSIFYAQAEMKNTYLLPSDIYMEKNLYRKYEYYSNYCAEYHELKTSEWKVEINGSNLITKVDANGGSNCWAINGPTFFTQDFSSKLVSLVNEVYAEDYAAQWYWEDVYMRNMNDLPMYIRKHPLGSIVEFESLEELRVFDTSYLDKSRSEILDVILSVFNCTLSDIKNIGTLKAGMTNDSFLFEVNNVKYVFRNPGKGTEQLIKRSEEADVYKVIDTLNISENILYLNPDHGYKISEYIHDARHLQFENKDDLESGLSLLRTLHNSNLKVDHTFDIEERIQFYLNLCKESNAILFTDFDDVYSIVLDVLSYIKGLERPHTLSHVDFVADNVLFDDHKAYLLDWEYAGMADPLMDVAMFVLYSGLNEAEADELLERYLERKPTSEEVLVTYSYIALGGFLWALWTQYKQAMGEDFGTYGMDQYRYARKYGRIVVNEK